MNLKLTLHVLGGLLLFMSGALLIPISVSLLYNDGLWWVYMASSLIAAGIGIAAFKTLKQNEDLGIREGFSVVTFGWLTFALFGALPYLLSGAIPGTLDAFFESVSGFTTTGATILTDIDALAPSILFWRSLTQWLGGMGIIVLSLAILPMLGVGGMQLFSAEAPGPTADRLTPRIQDTARLLWEVYLGITVVEIVLLGFGPMTWFDAVCHGLTTMATGGFSTSDASIAGWQSSYVHVVITFFMFLAGTNFALHYRLLRGDVRAWWRSEEFRVYASTALIASLVVAVVIYDQSESAWIALRDATFQVVSLITSTGYGSADYELWPIAIQMLLLGLMLMGGMAGSTGGGIKVVRIMLIFKHAQRQVFKLIHPRGVRFTKLDHKFVADEVIQGVLGFGVVYVALFGVSVLLISATGVDYATATSGVISAISNIGPGIGSIGPTENYAHLPGFSKWILAVCMIFGRLELFTVLVLFFPSFWRK